MDMGCTAFDTAHAYGAGTSERALGHWMKTRGNRQDVIIIDKGAHPSDGRHRVDPNSIKRDLQASLRRLKTDFIDLYLLHRDDPTVPVGPLVETLNDLKCEGKITGFGASNWTHQRLQQAEAYAAAHGLLGFSVSSNQFSLAVQYDNPYPGTLSINGASEKFERQWYEQTQTPLLAWSSLARGFFSGKFTPDNLDSFTDAQSRISRRCYARTDNFVRLQRVRHLANQKGVTPPQVALAYLFQQPLNVYAVTGSLNSAHFEKNVEALDMDLTEKETAWLDLTSDSLD